MSNASFKMNGVEVFSENAQVVSIGAGFPAGHIVKIYGPVFNNSNSAIAKTSTAFGEIHSSYRLTVDNMVSATNLLIFEFQAIWGSLVAPNSTTEVSIGESSDYTTPYAGLKNYHSSVSTNHGSLVTGTTVLSYNYYSTGGQQIVRNNKLFSLGHSGSKTFSPIYKSVQGNSVRGSSDSRYGSSEFFVIYEIQQ